MELTLYIKPWCPWCVEAVAWLEDKGYQFNTIDVLSDPVAYERMRRISQTITHSDLGNLRRPRPARF